MCVDMTFFGKAKLKVLQTRKSRASKKKTPIMIRNNANYIQQAPVV